jgi:hypothetical protein
VTSDVRRDEYDLKLRELDLSPLKAAWKARSYISNSMTAAAVAILAKRRRGGELSMDLILKESKDTLHVSDSSEVGLAMQAASIAMSWNWPVTQLVRSMVETASATNSRVRTKYTRAERSSGALGGWAGTKEVILYLLIKKARPTLVIETGVAQGYSSTFILKALEENGEGQLVSIDVPAPRIDPSRVDATSLKDDLSPGWIVPSELRGRWTLILGDARKELPRIDRVPDIFFHDSLHTEDQMRFEFEWALGKMAGGGYIVSDDIGRNDAFEEFVRRNAGQLEVLSRKEIGVARIHPRGARFSRAVG